MTLTCAEIGGFLVELDPALGWDAPRLQEALARPAAAAAAAAAAPPAPPPGTASPGRQPEAPQQQQQVRT